MSPGSSGPATWSLMPMVRRCRASENAASAPVVGRQQFARVLEKHRAARRQLHVARRALDESATEPVSLRAGKSEAYRQAIFDSPCRALHETFGGPRTTIPKTCS